MGVLTSWLIWRRKSFGTACPLSFRCLTTNFKLLLVFKLRAFDYRCFWWQRRKLFTSPFRGKNCRLELSCRWAIRRGGFYMKIRCIPPPSSSAVQRWKSRKIRDIFPILFRNMGRNTVFEGLLCGHAVVIFGKFTRTVQNSSRLAFVYSILVT